MNQNQPTPAEIVILAGGAVAFVFSFLPFFKAPSAFGSRGDLSAWSSGLFPVATLIALFGLVMAGQIALQKFAKVQFPGRFATFTWEQVHLALGFFAALLAVCYLIVDKGAYDLGFGFYLVLLGAAALLVGAIMLQRERSATGPI